MSIYLNTDDITNIFFVLQHRQIINTIIKEHSDLTVTIPSLNTDAVRSLHKIPFYCTLGEDNKLFLENNTKDEVISFVHLYFQNFELLQYCIEIYNTTHQDKRNTLRNTFTFITNEYNYKDTANTKPLRLFLKKYSGLTSHQEQSKSLLQYFFIESVNSLLTRYTNLSISIINTDISFLGQDKNAYKYHELSSGEQSFIRLILLIYSHDLHNGLLIIDEPEIHLHPQAQKEFLKLIKEMIEKQHIQVIIATHSPSLINEENIHNVFRCTKINGETKIYSTPHYNNTSDSTLLQLLKFDALAKIFFVDKILLVE